MGSEIAARNRKSLATFHRTLKSQCNIAFSCPRNRAISGVCDGHRNRKSQKSLRFRCAKFRRGPLRAGHGIPNSLRPFLSSTKSHADTQPRKAARAELRPLKPNNPSITTRTPNSGHSGLSTILAEIITKYFLGTFLLFSSHLCTLQPELVAKLIPKTLLHVTEMRFSKRIIPKQFSHVIL